MDGDMPIGVKVAIIGVLGLVGILMFNPIFVVAPGEVGVKFNRINGTTTSHSQGMHFRIPLVNGVEKFDVKTQRVDIVADSASKDLQQVKVHTVLNYHLVYEKVNDLYVKVGTDYTDKIINPAVNEAVKAAASQFPVEDIIVRRHDLKTNIEDTLGKKLVEYNIVLESLNLVDINFDPAFNKVVEDKQIEEQRIKTAEYVRRQAEENKKRTILDAEATAKSQELMKQTITKDIVALEWIKKWNGTLPSTMMGDKATFLITPEKVNKE